MSHNYNLRSSNTPRSENTPSNSESHTSSSASAAQRNPSTSSSPYFTGFVPYFVPSFTMAAQQNQVNVISASQDNLNAIGGDDHDAQNILEEDEPVGRTQEEVISVVDTVFKRNQTNSFLGRIKNDIQGLKDALIDQVAASIIDDEFQDVIDMVKTYNKIVGPLLDLPADPLRDTGINDFITSHKDEYRSLNEDVKSLKLRVQRVVTMDSMRSRPAPHATTSHPVTSQSSLKLPRIQIPRFEDNKTGTLDWENFKNMMQKLTNEMAPEERIFVLKSALSGESAKLVANEQDHDLAMAMLSSLYGNKLLQSQSKIQEFISLIHEEVTEKNHTSPNRSLWQRFKMFSNFLEQQLQHQPPQSVLHSLVCALIIQRVPHQMKSIIIRTRRELESQTGSSLTLDELLGLYNDLIHDLEISHGAQKEKQKSRKPEKDEEPSKSKRRSLLSRRDRPKKKCVLCSADSHNVRSHHFDKHGFYPIKKIREVLNQNNLCLKCCLPVEAGTPCEQAQCSNITKNCWNCNSREHHNILCDKPISSEPSSNGMQTSSSFEGGGKF